MKVEGDFDMQAETLICLVPSITIGRRIWYRIEMDIEVHTEILSRNEFETQAGIHTKI